MFKFGSYEINSLVVVQYLPHDPHALLLILYNLVSFLSVFSYIFFIFFLPSSFSGPTDQFTVVNSMYPKKNDKRNEVQSFSVCYILSWRTFLGQRLSGSEYQSIGSSSYFLGSNVSAH